VANTLITGLAGYFAMKLIRSKTPQVGAAVGTSAGNSAATPAAIAAADPTIGAVAAVATVQVAAAVIVTAILCPLLVTFLDRYERRKAQTTLTAHA
jgi:2-keto-3-deoxygluconate permease